jgi:hypothetical protein
LEIFHGLPTGEWVLRPNETTSINDAVHYGHMVLPASVTNMEFRRAVRLVVEDRGGAAWDAGYFVPNVNGLEKGDRLLLVVWLRTDSVSGERGRTGELRIFSEEESTDSKDFYLPINPTDRWQRYLIPFESRSNQPRRIGFHLACEKQVIEYGGLAVINYGQSVPFVDLPHELNQN